MREGRAGLVVIALAFLATGLLIGLEVQRGALDHGAPRVADPCRSRQAQVGRGVDRAAQRIAAAGLDAAACELRMGREELLLALASSLVGTGEAPAGAEEALRDGLDRAIQAERDAGRLDRVSAFLLRQAVRHTPVSWTVAAARELVERA
jgi:hypothetical protein